MRNIFKKQYFYIAVKKGDGQPVFYGPLKNANGSYCRNESEASSSAFKVCRGNLFDLRTSKHSTLNMATQELKAKKFEMTGDIDLATQRVRHVLRDNEMREEQEEQEL